MVSGLKSPPNPCFPRSPTDRMAEEASRKCLRKVLGAIGERVGGPGGRALAEGFVDMLASVPVVHISRP